ncbi:ATP-binding protein [Neptuniibacter caesariensis]|uniref:histidine kinase n=1 Tax=Neptuniibacter caesariensis TaxID=207954 RepID=A0A7U8C4U1_NEPCE|nr:sensor histidine kinase [Neptuniibacter caesariensis]EAR60766.1 two-component sensor histidine kinase [Neptuniibacter caesariensis]
MKLLRRLKLKSRMILVLGLMALVQTGFIGLFAVHYLHQSLDEQIGQRALDVAKTIAATPQIIAAVQRRDSEYLQPISMRLAEETQARFVVIGDKDGVRLAHPRPEKIGHSMSDDEGDDNSPALVDGKGYLSKALGSMGWSMRGKTPIFSNETGEIVGLVSVGYHLDHVDQIIQRYSITLVAVIIASFLLSALIAVWFAHHFKQAIFGLEPEQIARLFDEQKATLESVREGIIAINAQGRITTFNRPAIETLGLPEDIELTGRHITEVLPESAMMEVLNTGEPQFDEEVWRQDHSIIANRLPLKQGEKITGVVSSFRRKDEVAMVSKKLTRIQQYADSLRSQSHEYSNKLHTIAGLIQIGATDEALALIGQESQSHQELINLLVSAVPDPILAGCLLGKYNRAREMGLQLEIDPESKMSALPEKLPREDLVSIIGNLIDNALEATWEHSGTGGKVTLSMTDLGRDLIFEIEDQGPGVEEQNQDKIFEKGFSSKEKEGHGFGLHLVKSLLGSIGGMVTCESAESGGSRFIVYIPKNQA